MSISGVETMKSIPEINRDTYSVGQRKAGQAWAETQAPMRVSNTGSETKVGSSEFSRDNAYAVNLGKRSTQQHMEAAKSFYSVSNFGNETKLGKSQFQQANAQISAYQETVQNTKLMRQFG